MKASLNSLEMHPVLQELKHSEPVNAPLKAFTHHNSLRAFTQYPFYTGIRKASDIFGYKVLLTLEEYRSFFNKKRITADILEKVLLDQKGEKLAAEWRTKALFGKYNTLSQELNEVLAIWQDAFEWSYFDQVLTALKSAKREAEAGPKSFQALFCMDDREGSLRRYLEHLDSRSETFGAPGHFGLDICYQPANSNSYLQTCPPTITPRFLIKETAMHTDRKPVPHAGFWSKLGGIFGKSSVTPAAASASPFLGQFSTLTIENADLADRENGLQVGFSVEEMADRVEALFKSIALTSNFAPVLYVIGHASGEIFHPQNAALECCACSGSPGSVNARVFASIANHNEVRTKLRNRGISIPPATQFVPALHDTTRDEVTFYDEQNLSEANQKAHQQNAFTFTQALDLNAKERARRLEKLDKTQPAEKIHEQIRKRAAALLESQTEAGHANHALCIIGRRSLTKHLFLDRRAFLNSYDYSKDPEGAELGKILRTVVPLCSDINLEYFFARTDPRSFAVNARRQLVENHDPLRLMFIIEQRLEIVKRAILEQEDIYEILINEWAHLVVISPDREELLVFKDGNFQPYKSNTQTIEEAVDLNSLFETHAENLPVFTLHHTKNLSF